MMLLRVITIKFESVLEKFDDSELIEFIKDKDVQSIREHFFIKNETPYIAVIIQYLPNPSAGILSGSGGKKEVKSEESWRKIISEEDLPLFNALRDWRNEKAKQEGVPPYIICTNEHLAQMVKHRFNSLSGLSSINGFGKVKLEKYGKEILSLLVTKDQKQNKNTHGNPIESQPPKTVSPEIKPDEQSKK